MSIGEKTILLWKNPKYRKHMIESHKGQICPSRKGCVPWNKGLTKNTDNRVKINTEKLIGKKHIHRKKSYPKKSRKDLWKNPDYAKKQKERMKKWNREHPNETHNRAIKAGMASLESRRKNLPYKLFNISFFSKGELEVAKQLLKIGIIPEYKNNCHVRFGNNEYDFFIFDTFIIEYHPKDNFRRDNHQEYCFRRKESLIKNQKKQLILIVVKQIREFVYILRKMGFEEVIKVKE
jgi:hypothetical protein